MIKLREPGFAPRSLWLLLRLAAVALGLKYGYEFGMQISGSLLGVVAALNLAACVWLGLGAVPPMAERLLARRPRHGSEPQQR